ncbi:transporter [Vibrio zhanjiangensis]|uniref:Transporter n=1 Tax=Vibrio zhanjiangensis TaxID=1046128 RepID=A0ABQ6F2U3_9VIBR|nr:YeeE/YedE family protein [Vibrio zhanjiangensis]GLT19823.1 transporter [Vibrio zhanjiangensis]
MTQAWVKMSIFISGLLFGLGMTLSGMIDPDKVIGFLNITGQWDPSLAFVLGGALAVYTPAYHLWLKHKTHAWSGATYCFTPNKTIDTRLIVGAGIFGVGWGLVGICPGPAVASLGFGNLDIAIFIVAMIIGSLLAKRLTRG